MVRSATGVEIPEARDIARRHSQVRERERAPPSTHCTSPPSCGSDSAFLQGSQPRAQNKAAHPPPLSLNSMAEAPSSLTGKRQTCDIEGTLGTVGARDQKHWGPLKVGRIREA